MGIQSTQYINRESAIARIKLIVSLIEQHAYRDIESESYETDHSLRAFVDAGVDIDITYIDQWSDGMLEEILDRPFYRKSLFDNYSIREYDD